MNALVALLRLNSGDTNQLSASWLALLANPETFAYPLPLYSSNFHGKSPTVCCVVNEPRLVANVSLRNAVVCVSGFSSPPSVPSARPPSVVVRATSSMRIAAPSPYFEFMMFIAISVSASSVKLHDTFFHSVGTAVALVM